MKCISWSSNSAASPSPGSIERAATTARHARDVPATRSLTWNANGIPKRRWNTRHPAVLPAGV